MSKRKMQVLIQLIQNLLFVIVPFGCSFAQVNPYERESSMIEIA